MYRLVVEEEDEEDEKEVTLYALGVLTQKLLPPFKPRRYVDGIPYCASPRLRFLNTIYHPAHWFIQEVSSLPRRAFQGISPKCPHTRRGRFLSRKSTTVREIWLRTARTLRPEGGYLPSRVRERRKHGHV